MITNITTGFDPSRIQQNKPAFFVSWTENEQRQYFFHSLRFVIENKANELKASSTAKPRMNRDKLTNVNSNVWGFQTIK